MNGATDPAAITRCRVCGNTTLDTVLDLGSMALTGVFPSSDPAAVPSHPLELVRCIPDAGRSCGLVQLRHTADLREMYSDGYGYRSGLNKAMVTHLRAVVAGILRRVDIGPGDLVLDIGSNDATLLRSYPPGSGTRVGIDPVGEKFGRYYPPDVLLLPDFFSRELITAALGTRRAKVITSIAMFYDLPRPLDFMADIRACLADDGIWVLEQSYLPAMLASTSYDTICHEHLEYYALHQVEWMAQRAGLVVLEVTRNDVNGGSFALTLAPAGTPYRRDSDSVQRLRAEEARLGLDGPDAYADFARRSRRHREAIRDFFERSRAAGRRTVGYGASTKGNVLLQYCGLDTGDLPCIAEVNEDKFGKFTPSTGIPIVSEDQARDYRPDQFFVLPWHFRDTLIEREREFRAAGGRLVFPLPHLSVV